MPTRTDLENPNSAVVVTNVSEQGLWLLTAGRRLFLPYSEFPWFRGAPASSVFNVEEPRSGHYYWPDLDVDLELGSIEHPESFPLKFT